MGRLGSWSNVEQIATSCESPGFALVMVADGAEALLAIPGATGSFRMAARPGSASYKSMMAATVLLISLIWWLFKFWF